jgi:ATP-dependent RNA helicase DDX24/MAK5
MGKRKSKAAGANSVWSSLPWKKASTSNGSAESDDNDGETNHSLASKQQHPDELGYNHYDDPDTTDARFEGELYDAAGERPGGGKKKGGGKRQAASRSTAMEGADDPGILFGFDVVDASHFIVKKQKVGGGEVSHVIPVTKKDSDGNKDDEESNQGADKAAPEEKKKKVHSDKQSKKDSSGVDSSDEDGNNDDASDEDDDGDAKTNSTVEEEEEEIRRLRKRLKRKEAKLRKKKRKQEDAEKKKKQQAAQDVHDNDGDDNTEGPTRQEVDAVRTNWSVSAPGVYLHEKLCRGLARQGFATPMPIQSSTLPASILGRRDIVGAAPTGSGKTLAYALPMLQGILTARDETNDDGGGDDNEAGQPKKKSDTRVKEPLTGMVLCPTRELAVQVSSEILKVCCKEVEVGTIVGGLAEQKQKRVLNVKRPPILVATPGRLWELVSFPYHLMYD